jgi:predicted Fe-Mo cluster-binding NifX family protein
MKIAVVTDDGKVISQHFGRASFYLVATVEDGKILERQLRDKPGHNQFASQGHGAGHHAGQHGQNTESHNKHVQMAEAISDCEALLCGGMGMGAFQSMQTLGIKPVVTEITAIDQALLAYVNGEIIDRVDKLH